MTSPVHGLSVGLELTEPKQKLVVVRGGAGGAKQVKRVEGANSQA